MKRTCAMVVGMLMVLGGLVSFAPTANAGSILTCAPAANPITVGDALAVNYSVDLQSIGIDPVTGAPFVLDHVALVIDGNEVESSSGSAGTLGVSIKVQQPGSANVTCKLVATTGNVLDTGSFTLVITQPPAPLLTGLSPASGPSTGGTPVTITGTDLTGTTTVTFGGAPATNVTIDSNTQVTAVAPAGRVGVVDVGLDTPSGHATLPGQWTWTVSPPQIMLLAPTCDLRAGSGTVLVTGTSLAGVTSATVGSLTARFLQNSSSDTQVIITVPAGVAAGPQSVTITTTGPPVTASQTITTAPCTPIPAPVIDRVTLNPNGGVAVVDWHVPDASRSDVQGVKYLVNGLIPLTPVGGIYNAGTGYGQFTITGITKQDSLLRLIAYPFAPTTTFQATAPWLMSFGVTPTVPALPATPGVPTAITPPTINSVVTVASGGLVTVNYSIPNPTGIAGIEYQIATGAWLRPGGTPPSASIGGSFTLSGVKAQNTTITLRSVSTAIPPTYAVGAQTPVTFSSSPTRPSTNPTVPANAGGPVPAGTSNGAGTGTNGADAASTGDAGVDAPCLAADGTLYPNQYSTVGSQLTMAPNTRGMPQARSFTVVRGSLAPGTVLDRQYGVINGVTTQPGTYTATIKALFVNGKSTSSTFATRVDTAPQTLQYAARNAGVVGKSVSIAATTNAPAVGTTYTLVCGKLPTGTVFNSATGSITGTPTRPVYRPTPLRVAEKNADGTAAASFIFVVDQTGAATINYPARPHARVSHRSNIRPTIVGGTHFTNYKVIKGKLPAGLRLNRHTGAITGKPARAGTTHSLTIMASRRGAAPLVSNVLRITIRR